MSENDLAVAGSGDWRHQHQRPLHVGCWDFGNEMVSAQWDRGTFCDPFWRFYLADRDGLELIQGGGSLAYPPDAVTVIPAWSSFTFQADTSVRHAFLHCSLSDWGSPIVRQFFPTAFHVSAPDLVGRFRALARGISDDQTAALQISQADGLVADLLQRVMAAWPVRRQTSFWQATRHPRLDPVLAYIDAHLDQSLAVADLAALLGVGQARCIRLFKAVIGQTPIQYILERRVARAATLLAEAAAPLDEIAKVCGFGNRRYLGRMFHQRMGMSPGVYRRRLAR